MSKPTTIEDVLKTLQRATYENGYDTADRVIALATIEQLVLERVIGEDFPPERDVDDSHCVNCEAWLEDEQFGCYCELRNDLRSQQRQALKQLLGGER